MTHYHITDLDTMGQGVAKADGHITFIAKTLPNEVVEAQVYRSKKTSTLPMLPTSSPLLPSAKKRLAHIMNNVAAVTTNTSITPQNWLTNSNRCNDICVTSMV